GGVGKTRLAIEASGRLGAAAWFVPLAPVTEPAEVAYTVLDALGIREPVIARRAAAPGTGPGTGRSVGWAPGAGTLGRRPTAGGGVGWSGGGGGVRRVRAGHGRGRGSRAPRGWARALAA